MKIIKKRFIYLFGGFIAFTFKCTSVFAETERSLLPPAPSTLYGVEPMSVPAYGIFDPMPEELSFWEKTISIVLSPIFIVTIIALTFIIGTIVFIKRKRKNAKKNS